MRHAIAMVIVSAGSMVVEIVAARMLAPLVGMTVFSWTAVIATVLAGLSIGHWIGGRLADCEPGRARRRVFALLIATAATTPAPILLVGPVHAAAEALGIGWMAATVAIAGTCFLLPSLLAGAVTPILTAIAVAEAPGHPGVVIGRMFALGAAGAIVGTGIAGFVLLQWVGSIGSLGLVAGAEILVAGLYLRGLAAPVIGIAAQMVILAGAGLALAAPRYCTVESRYFCLGEVNTTDWAGFPSRGLFMDGWIQSVEPLDGSQRLAINPHAFLDAWAERRHPPGTDWTAFFIGGGGYSLPMRWVERWPRMVSTVAEIDPAVTEFAETIGFRRDHDRIRIHDDDARSVLRRTADRYDLVFSDAYSGHTMPAHLVSVEFHRQVRAHLTESGAYAINAHDWAQSPRFLAALVRTLEQVFPNVAVWVSSQAETRRGGRSTFVVLASRDPIDRSPINELEPGSRTWAVMDAVPGSGSAPLLSDDYAPVDRLTLR
ncbi:fused MFS/spermidine synthase [Thalassobaculum sp.]|uniref:fused MFS/spermidine synthase n=1 Tax=Thalassobaculum sp. TaxID=2022740 RepID=UPI0032EF5B74